MFILLMFVLPVNRTDVSLVIKIIFFNISLWSQTANRFEDIDDGKLQ